MLVTVVLCTFVFLLTAWRLLFAKAKFKYPFPPGPKGLPFLGNLHQIPGKHLEFWLRDLHKQYGPIVHFQVGNEHLVSLGELELAKEVLEKKASINSARPQLVFMERYFNPDNRYWALIDSDADSWKRGRRLTNQVMHKDRLKERDALVTMEARLMAMRILESPASWREEFDRLSVSVAMTSVYGVQSLTGKEVEIEEIQALNLLGLFYCRPTFSIINFLPFLDNLPGNLYPWRKEGAAFQKRQNSLYGALVPEAITGSRSRMNTWCKMFWEAGEKVDDPKGFSNLCSQLFGAATETTSIALANTILASMLYPDAFEPVYRQIDEVVGSERLPEFLDHESLPLVDALIHESLRWKPPVPSGLPHKTSAEQIIRVGGTEYGIPKGSIIYGATLVIDHDASRWSPDPEDFRPERHLDKNGQLNLEEITAFGYGRRVCPGAPFAVQTMWITLATILWMFRFEKQPGFDYDRCAFTGEIVTAPLPFPCAIKPRRPEHVEAFQRAWDLQEKDLEVLLPVPK